MTAAPAAAIWFIRLRWVAGAGILVATGLAEVAGASLQPIPLYVAGIGVLALNGLYLAIGGRQPIVTGAAAHARRHAQAAADLVVLAWVVHYTGGPASPVAAFFVFHLVLAAISLQPLAAYSYASTATGLALIPALAARAGWVERPPSPFPAPESAAGDLAAGGLLAITLHVAVFLASTVAALARHREQELRQLNRRLQAQKAATSQYVMVVCHEISGSLAAIHSNTQAVRDAAAGALSPQAGALLDRALRRNRELAGMVADLLALSRLRSVAGHREPEVVDAGAIWVAAASAFAALADGRSLDYQILGPPGLLPVKGRREDLDLIASNLVSNAVKYTPAGGQIEVLISGHGGCAGLLVTDTGIGIASKDRAAVLRDFFRADNAIASGAPGTGLGLAIVQQAVLALGGTLELRDATAAGTRASVSVPLATGPPRRIS